MADTFTPHYNFTLPQIGGDVDSWGDLLNANFTAVDTVLWAKLDKVTQRPTGNTADLTVLTIADQTAVKRWTINMSADPDDDFVLNLFDSAGALVGPILTVHDTVTTGTPNIHTVLAVFNCSVLVDKVLEATTIVSDQNILIKSGSPVPSGATPGLYIQRGQSAASAVQFVNVPVADADAGGYLFNNVNHAATGTTGYMQLGKTGVLATSAQGTMWGTANFNPSSYQPAGNYNRSLDGNVFGLTWTGQLQNYVNGSYVGQTWTSSNFDPNSKANAGAQTQWDTGLVEFALVNISGGTNSLGDSSAPYVLEGLRTDQNDHMYLRSVALSNQ